MPRLRRVSPASAGWSRRRAGRGFCYHDEHGRRLPAEAVERIKSLVIPPAWQEVWICPVPNGHIQATGRDAAGRLQYLYHPSWRQQRDLLKFDRIAALGAGMHRARAQILADLSGDGMPLVRASATAGRLLDLGYFRIGSDTYADENGSFGLTTLQRQHVRMVRGELRFTFAGKSGIDHTVRIDDPDVITALDLMRRRRGAQRLLCFKDGGRWRDLTAAMVNEYLASLLQSEMTAKDFRTWHATVIAAIELAEVDPGQLTSQRATRRAITQAVDSVAQYLGNTPAIARSSYIDPRVIERFEAGQTVASALRRPYDDPIKQQARVERAVARLLLD